MKKTIALSAMTAMALSGLAYSQDDSAVSADFAVSWNSDYVFRGADLGDDLFTYGLDVSGSCDCGFDWSAGIWYAEFDAGSTTIPANSLGLGLPESTIANSDEELDIYAGISKDFGFGTLGLGFIRFIFPDDDNAGNTEIYLTYGTSFAGIDLGVGVYWNAQADDNSVTDQDDLYYELSASYGHDFTDKLSGSVGAVVGFNNTNGGLNGFSHVTTTLGLSYAVSENVSVDPYLAYTGADEDLDSDSFFGGVSVGFSF